MFANFENDKKKNNDESLLNVFAWRGAKRCKSGRSRKDLSNEHLLAKIGFFQAKNEPRKIWIANASPGAGATSDTGKQRRACKSSAAKEGVALSCACLDR